MRRVVQDIQGRLRSTNADLNFVDPSQAHFTIKFLGDTSEEQIPYLKEILEDTAEKFDPFKIHLKDTGVFPDREYISVVWIGAEEGGETLRRIHEMVEEEVVNRGLAEEENHEFTPHVTIARMKSGRGKTEVHKFLDKTDRVDIGEFTVGDLRLKESKLQSDGPVYTTIHEAGLGAQKGVSGGAAGSEGNS